MITNALELTKFLSDQARNSGFANACIVIVMGHDGQIHKTEFGFNRRTDVGTPNVVSPGEEPAVEAAKEAEQTDGNTEGGNQTTGN